MLCNVDTGIAIHTNWIMKEQMLKFENQIKTVLDKKKNKSLFSYSSVTGASLNG